MDTVPYALTATDADVAKSKGKVLVLTGGAQGIGGALVRLAFAAGAHVVFGDWDAAKGAALAAELQASPAAAAAGGSVLFRRVDVRSYASQLALFAAAHAAHGRIDTAVPLAAGAEPRGWFEPEALTPERLQEEPAAIRDRLETNVLAVLFFCRIALGYMRAPEAEIAAAAAADAAAGRGPGSGLPPARALPKSIVLIASHAGLVQAPGVPVYVTSKHAVMGMLRSLAPYAPHRYGVRVNALCPSTTDTRMVDSLTAAWRAAGLPINTPDDVARLILLCANDAHRNANAVFVQGGRAVDVEQGYINTMPVWMGLQHTLDIQRGRAFNGLGDGWVETKTSWQEMAADASEEANPAGKAT